ncbi:MULTISPECIES: SRPBCC family protein [unclassified Bacillus (in: firmicutes)]|uniref:SRPBCC family protein n=1 Tax=unclassified Bacillus (in: firmicutes) TaxID=185979 RepID=UPI000BF0AB66|nr:MULTISPECIES: SRPBCC family protein [unclassified Bacillus (in: firmicutes)]PEJ57345.1 hypothetical protein CN692_13075 [Bacillus sp. AFS002410]PEL12022.1 hypothetical protein CN601_08405 [Bacillus sp. AFS017336]
MSKTTNYSLTINAPIEAVFEVIDSDEHMKKWMDGFIENQYDENYNRENPVGHKFKQKLKEDDEIQEYEGEIISYKPPTELSVRLKHSNFTVDAIYHLSSIGANQTNLDYECKLEMESMMGFIFSWFEKRTLVKQLDRLKKYAEERFDGVL